MERFAFGAVADALPLSEPIVFPPCVSPASHAGAKRAGSKLRPNVKKESGGTAILSVTKSDQYNF